MKNWRIFFENLNFREEIIGLEKENIIYRMYSYVYSELSHKNIEFNDYKFFLNDREEIYVPLFNEYSEEDLFYVLTNKGKKKFLKTRVVTATKKSLFDFFEKEEEAGEETSYIILPLDKDKANFIFKNNEDWSFYVIKIPKQPTLNFDNIKII